MIFQEVDMKKALVTGAAGFIGSQVVRELQKEDIEVRAMIRPGEPLGNLEGIDCEQVQADLLDADAVKRR
jgi:dihydroflavonol-4-reductase